MCPTEIAEFGKLNARVRDRDAQVLGVWTDTQFVHLAWRSDHAGPQGAARSRCWRTPSASCRRALGILDKQEGVPLRATFIVDPAGRDPLRRASTTCRSAATWTRCCACSTRCRPTSCARATGRRASRRCRWPEGGSARRPPGAPSRMRPRTCGSTWSVVMKGGALTDGAALGGGGGLGHRRRNPRLREAVSRMPAAPWTPAVVRRCSRRRGPHGDEQRLPPIPSHGRQADLLGEAGGLAHEPARERRRPDRCPPCRPRRWRSSWRCRRSSARPSSYSAVRSSVRLGLARAMIRMCAITGPHDPPCAGATAGLSRGLAPSRS